MQRRAELVDETRLRIVEAAVELHGSLGPAATTIAAIADRASVTRATVYRHFEDDAAIFAACSAHWASRQVMPDPAAWARIDEFEERLRYGLADLYRFYRDGASMLTRIYGDIDALPAAHREGLLARGAMFRDVLVGTRRGKRVRGVVGHAVSFWTWHSLVVENGLSNREAVDAMTALALGPATS